MNISTFASFAGKFSGFDQRCDYPSRTLVDFGERSLFGLFTFIDPERQGVAFNLKKIPRVYFDFHYLVPSKDSHLYYFSTLVSHPSYSPSNFLAKAVNRFPRALILDRSGTIRLVT